MKWQLKWLANSLFGLLPFPAKLKKFKRRYFPFSSEIDAWAVEQGIRQVEMLASVAYSTKGKNLLEIGTGWQPIVPIIFHLSGCKKIILTDTEKLMDRRLFLETVKNLTEYKNKLSQRLEISVEDIEKKLTIDNNTLFRDALNHFSMKYFAPFKLLQTKLPDKCVDIIISRAVLEFIDPNTIKKIFAECRRLLTNDGKMCHIIDNSDHWEHNDKTISRLNFLKFSDNLHKLLSSFNYLNYKNRLRHFEYIELLKHSGFKIDYDGSEVDRDAINKLQFINICKRYKNIPHEELSILTSYIVTSKA